MAVGAGTGARIVRRELLAATRSATVCVIEAPSGFGKTTFARALSESFEIATVVLTLSADTDTDGLFGGIVEGMQQVGLTDLADAAARWQPDSATGELPRMIDATVGRLCLVVDEVQRLSDTAATWLAGVAASLPAGSHVVLAGRRLPPALADQVERRQWPVVDAGALRFTTADAIELLGQSFDADAAQLEDRAAELIRLTSGWPAAVDLLAALPGRPRGLADGPLPAQDLMTQLVDAVLATSSADREALRRLAAIPLVSRSVAVELDAAADLDAAIGAGLPLTRRPDGWLVMADPIRDALGVARLELDARRAAAEIYCRAGELSAAAHLLYAGGDIEGIAAVIAARSWTELERAGVSFARLVAGLVGMPASPASVTLFVTLARAVEHDDPALRTEYLGVADQATAGTSDALRRTIEAELAVAAVRRGDVDTASARAAAAMRGSGEAATRARALYASAVADTIRATPGALTRAAAAFGEAAALAELVGEPRWQADALLRLGYSVSFHGGDIDAAIGPIERSLALTPSAGRQRGVVLTYLADVLDCAGRTVEADAACREALTIGRRIHDHALVGMACWASAGVAAHSGDHAATVEFLDEATRHHSPWLDSPSGAEFRLFAADVLLSLGDEDGGRRCLDAARDQIAALGIDDALTPLIARYEAMFGDAERAESILAEIEGRPFAVVRGRWTRALMRAYAAHRRGDQDAARTFRASALREASRLGYPDLPVRHERWLDAELRYLDDTVHGNPTVEGRGELRLLGTFALLAAGADETPPHGNPATLIKLLAVRGELTNDEVIDVLWPDVDTATGRARLRNTLNRLRSRSGDVVIRRGDSLAVSPSVTIDATSFDEAAGHALAAPESERAGMARRAASMYAGELLPGDRYEDWAAAPRERLRRRYLALVDLLADDAEARGDLDEAVRQLDAGSAIEPLDERRYLRAARMLLLQGRRASARDVVRRALAVGAELDISPSAELRELVAGVGGDTDDE
jgi:DNA-binding SARP family transcriptional activator/ATP/maltotriose-dependent transcriptional regulator MalT